jgi:hypothetical protein
MDSQTPKPYFHTCAYFSHKNMTNTSVAQFTSCEMSSCKDECLSNTLYTTQTSNNCVLKDFFSITKEKEKKERIKNCIKNESCNFHVIYLLPVCWHACAASRKER